MSHPDGGLLKEEDILRIREDIARLRKEKNMTQKDLAAKTGIQQAHISRLESGNANPSIKFLKRLAAGLGKELHITLR